MILIDATTGNRTPGEVHVIRPRFASEFPRSLTSHDIGLKDLIQSAEILGELPDIYLITINIQDVHHVGIGISRLLQSSLEEVYRAVRKILGEIVTQAGSTC